MKAILCFCVLAIGLAGCEPAEKNTDKRLQVVTTVGMLADLAVNIGGDLVAVRGLMGPGVDPHLYRATEGDIRLLAGGDLVLYGGLHLEAKLAEVLGSLPGGARTEAVFESIAEERLIALPDGGGQHDPHLWFDVPLWQLVAARVTVILSEMLPEHRVTIKERGQLYQASLGQLHQQLLRMRESVPAQERILVTAHDAFHYFGRAYGFDVHGLQGISTVTEAGARDVQQLAELIASRKVRAIFVESSVPRKSIEALQEAVRARDFDVAIGGELFSDAMGQPGTPAGTYIGMVRHNMRTIVQGLQGVTDAAH